MQLVIVISCFTFVLETLPGLQRWDGVCAQCRPISETLIFDDATLAAYEAAVAERKTDMEHCAENNCEAEPNALEDEVL